MIKLFLRLLVVTCFAIIGWTAYLLLTHRTDPVIGGLILAVDIGVLVWNLSVLRKYRISFRSIVLTGIILALLLVTNTACENIGTYLPKTSDKVIITEIWVSEGGGGPIARILEQPFPYNLVVKLKPTKSIKPNLTYSIVLYEKGYKRSVTSINWTQPQLNVLEEQRAIFPITSDEFQAYQFKDISHIFTIRSEVLE